MCLASGISNATDARSDFVLQIVFAVKQRLRERIPILRNTYIGSIVIFEYLLRRLVHRECRPMSSTGIGI